jgi:hypothetical protein
MKKCLTLIALMFSMASFANYGKVIPTWDVPLNPKVRVQVVKPIQAFTDPYVTNYGGWVVGTPFHSPYQLALQVNFDHAVPVKYYATFQVEGVWASAPGGTSYKEFQVIINAGNAFKTQYFTLNNSDTPYPNAWCEVIDYGPY